jgi:integrase/recombinase XerD
MDSKLLNKKILEYIKQVKPDRSWTEIEIVKFLRLADKLGRYELVLVVYVALLLGLRINEAVSLKTERVVKALEDNKLYLTNTKGGRPRTLYLSHEQRGLLEIIKESAEGEYAICPLKYVKNHEIHKFRKSIQNFINKHQKSFADPDRETMPTFHGLRHTFAQNLDRKLIAKGYSLEKSAIKVGNALGHGDNRPDITYAYLHR